MTQPFYFPNGQAANDARDLLELCQQYPDEATGFLVRHDLENWLAYIGSYDVAECAANARQIEAEDRQKLEDFLQKCHSLNSSTPVPTAAPEPNIQDNLTAPDTATPTPEATPEAASKSQIDATTSAVAPEKAKEKPLAPQPATLEAKTAARLPTNSDSDLSSTNGSKKPSFFQVVAKFIVKILYRNKT